ncbi:MAG: helix-hairpin-helix domain-containing protein [Chloroflexi bacterium]|nr:helix-hairpin-helix domain-containing protein [Chloroflexota bacterium]
MSYYKINWSQFVTDASLAILAGQVGAPITQSVGELRPFVASICASAGGLPVTEQPLDEAARTAVVLRLVNEGLAHALHTAHEGGRRVPDNYVQTAGPGMLAEIVTPVTPLNLNTASVKEMVHLPGIGPTLAARIVGERLARGLYSSLDDLDRRVKGVGPTAVGRLRYRVRFGSPLEATNTAVPDLAGLTARMPGATIWEQLVAALDAVATTCAADPHPATKEYQPRNFDLALAEPESLADWVGVLSGLDYFRRLPALLQNVTTSLDVCLFHIALPEPTHPTRLLLEALVAAHNRGVAVRVLLDADRPEDPYRSSVINAPAQAYLTAAGIPVQFDSTERLLHSKYLVADGSLVILGSHNWSAGSYFVYDDLSLVIQSVELAQTLTARFVSLWQEASERNPPG